MIIGTDPAAAKAVLQCRLGVYGCGGCVSIFSIGSKRMIEAARELIDNAEVKALYYYEPVRGIVQHTLSCHGD